MTDKSDIKRLERRAKSMLLTKEIPSAKMDVVRSLMNNENLLPSEKYTAVIDLIENCHDKKSRTYDKEEKDHKKNKTLKETVPQIDNASSAGRSVPTETSYFINSIYDRYKHLKLFKKKYLAHRNNMIGLGFRKRLIPSNRLLKILRNIEKLQEHIASKLSKILMHILNDETIEEPELFNYMRIVRKWMMDMPFSKHRFDSIKWMERSSFEREFKDYIIHFFSIIKLDVETRERIILQIENTLRSFDNLRKEEIAQDDSEHIKREKEKNNLKREKEIYDYIMLIRSFLPTDINEDNHLSKLLKHKYHIDHFSDLLLYITEALIFQRPFQTDDMINYFKIEAPKVSLEAWDYSEELLKKVGKDPESRLQKRIKSLEKQLVPYETMVVMLKKEIKGQNMLLKAAYDQWKNIDKKHYDPEVVYNEKFFNFLDALVHYFKNKYFTLLDGTQIMFRDKKKTEHRSSIFSSSYMEDKLKELSSILDEMHYFRSNNPTLSITRKEVKKILDGKIDSMAHVGSFVITIGDFFYKIGKGLQERYDLHKLWVFYGKTMKDENILRKPIDDPDITDEEYNRGIPIPFYDSIIKEIDNTNPLNKKLIDNILIDDKHEEGLFVNAIAFSYQLAYECFNERIYTDINARKAIIQKIREMKR